MQHGFVNNLDFFPDARNVLEHDHLIYEGVQLVRTRYSENQDGYQRLSYRSRYQYQLLAHPAYNLSLSAYSKSS